MRQEANDHAEGIMTREKRTPHTPGPWTLQEDPLGVAYFDPEIEAGANKDNPRHDSLIARCDEEFDDEESQANARLIAAAPELLTALKNAVSRLDDWASAEDIREYEVTPEGLRSLSRDLQKSIAQAEGHP